MSNPAIRARAVSKKFRIGHAGRGDVLDRVMDRVLGRRARRDVFWALRDVDFDVPDGDNFGLVGPNGSGKTTPLRIIARIYRPTTGLVHVNGRVVPFLELGWGLLEPEQTGAGNIYYAGVLFGLSRKEIDLVFDDIVRFADLEQYLHTPLKYYSTGMQIRLTFAIALFCRPEIFLVDEILAVGDIAFRQKCYDALKGLHREDMTLIIVSHDLRAIKEFCNHGLFLLNGRVKASGDIDDVIQEYIDGAWIGSPSPQRVLKSQTLKSVDILDVRIRDSRGGERSTFQPWDPVEVAIDFRVNDEVESLLLHLEALGEDGDRYFGTTAHLDGSLVPLRGRRARATVSIPHIPILQGKVLFAISAMNSSMTTVYDKREKQDSLWILNTTGSEGKVDFHPEWRLE